MRRDLIILAIILIPTLIIFRQALGVFFVQDDFILIDHFSQNNLWRDLKNTFGKPEVTHWRPFHNLYFLIAGNIFNKNYVGYHLLTITIHVSAVLFVFKIGQFLTKNNLAALLASLFYALHPAHFVSIFWISGASTTIGFLFLSASFWCFLLKKKVLAIISFIFALLASEAMIVGIGAFVTLAIIRKNDRTFKFLLMLVLIGSFFVLIKLVLTPSEAYEIYKPEISTKTIKTSFYYVLRILGFAEISGDQLTSLLILIFWIVVIVSTKKWLFLKSHKQFILASVIIVAGLFPFVLAPAHLSPHYMNISIWGLAIFLASVFKNCRIVTNTSLLLILMVTSFVNIADTFDNNWVIKRSILARTYLDKINKNNIASGSMLIFSDNEISTSKEAYISLGSGKAIDFWFDDKEYKYCFTFKEKCEGAK